MKFFAVYQLHFRLPEPSVHAQPLVQTPPMMHLEGLHTVHWLMSKMDTLSQTVRGDCQRFALKDHDSSMLIPHVPLPLMAGPFLLDTIKNSKYVVLPHQPNVKLDKKEIGIFFWLIASPWRCIELPAPKFVNKFTAKGVVRKRAKAAADRMKGVDDAKQAIDELEEAQRTNDEMTPDEYYEADQKIEEHKKKVTELEAEQQKALAADADAKRYAKDVDSDMGKAPEGEKKADREQRQWELEHEAKAEEIDEKAAQTEKMAADMDARNAKRQAEDHEAKAKENYRKAAGASGGGNSSSIDKAVEHEAKAKEYRDAQEKAEARSKSHDEKAKSHSKSARESRRRKSKKDNRQAAAKDYSEKQGKGNPYQDAMGTGNVGILAPSLLAHIPFPCTVFIERPFLKQLGSLALFGLGQALEYAKGVLGFVFDSLGAGRGMLGEQAAALAKAISDMLFDSAKDFAVEGKVGFKLSTKHGPVTVSAELTRGDDGEWSWKASGKVEKGPAEISHEYKVTNTKKDGTSSREVSTSSSAAVKVKHGETELGEASYGHSESMKTSQGPGGNMTETTSSSDSAKVGPVEASVSNEHKYSSTSEGGETNVEVTDTTTTTTKVGHGPVERSEENKTVTTQTEDGQVLETSKTSTDKVGPYESSKSSGGKVETSTADGQEVTTVTSSSSSSTRAGPVDSSQSSETKVTSTSEGDKITTEKSQTSNSASTTNPSQYKSSSDASTVSKPPAPPVDYSHGAPSI